MPHPLRQNNVPVFALLLAGACALLALLGGLSPASAEAGCRYSHANPHQLTGKEARKSISCLLNKERDRNGRGDYSNDGRLTEAANRHSGTMAKKHCFAHQCSGERSLLGRLQNVNYIEPGLRRYAYGENIAHGRGERGSPRKVVSSWMNASGHRSAILSGTFKEMGVGYEESGGGSHAYYTVDFGMRRG